MKNKTLKMQNLQKLKKIKIEFGDSSTMSLLRYNETFIKLFGELKDVRSRQGDAFRAKAYQKAQETIMAFMEDIVDPCKQLKGKPGIGPSILGKIEEYMNTGVIAALEREKNNPVNLFTEIYGVGPKKAQELVTSGITTISELRNNIDSLNDVQKVGLKHYDDIIKRIPRSEIDDFFIKLGLIFEEFASQESKFDIVGSYRRGVKDSGDIDIIITNEKNDNSIFNIVIDYLIKDGIIVEVLSRGKVKSLVIGKIYPEKDTPVRRLDFLYAPPNEYAFAVLYFTGSKTFNTLMRQRAQDMGYTLNEHGLSYMKNGVKGAKIDKEFPDEKSIFDFLGMKYKDPEERIDGRSVERISEAEDTTLTPHPITELGPIDPTASGIAKNEVLCEPPLKSNPTASGIAKAKNTTLKKPKTVSILELYIEKFKAEGITTLKMMTESELNEMICAANNAYYCEDKNEDPLLTDSLYDILVEYTLEKYPDNTVAKEGHTGCDITVEKNKAKLPYELWSMDKIKPDGNSVSKWTTKYTGPYVVSCKLDGISALYVSGNDAKLYTRGNGTCGQDITHLIPYLIKVKKNDSSMAVRGEIIIKKKVFETKYANKFANPRNFVAGLVNKKTINPDILGDLDFVPYEVIKPFMKPSDQMRFIKDMWDCEPVKYTVIPEISNEILSELLLSWRENYEYEIDGTIVVNDEIYSRPKKNPEYAFAFKMVISDQVVEAKVVDVLWTPSKDGYLKPRVRIEPVVLGGAKIEYATGFNGKFIQDNKIGIGAVVSIVRSGDVIPHIISVVIPAEQAKMPLNGSYKWNETGVDIILENGEDNATVKEKNITGFFKGIEVDGLGAGNVARIIKAGYDTVPLIIMMSLSDYLKVEGFKTKLATKIMDSIKEKVDGASLSVLMAASNIFGRGFGERRFEAILKVYPDILVSELDEKDKIGMVVKIEGMAGKTATKFVEHIPLFVAFMKECGLESKLFGVETELTDLTKLGGLTGPLYDKKIVMTGFRDKDIIEKIKALGGDIVGSVTKNTFVVIVKDMESDSGKADQAKKLNIPLLSAKEFEGKYLN
jgi:NAD-dependent DNA ligase/DNA polymerase/3'-5' exonuclease PolX